MAGGKLEVRCCVAGPSDEGLAAEVGVLESELMIHLSLLWIEPNSGRDRAKGSVEKVVEDEH